MVDDFPSDSMKLSGPAQLAINAQPVPPPDMVTSNVSGPGTAFSGTNITVHYQVTNLGTGVTFPGTWTDAIWLTISKGTRPNANNGDILLGTFSHSGTCKSASSIRMMSR